MWGTPVSVIPPPPGPPVPADTIVLICSSYCPRKRKPWERSGTCWICSFTQVLYVSLFAFHIAHWLPLSVKADSFTIVMQSSTGQTDSQAPQPQHARPGGGVGEGHPRDHAGDGLPLPRPPPLRQFELEGFRRVAGARSDGHRLHALVGLARGGDLVLVFPPLADGPLPRPHAGPVRR